MADNTLVEDGPDGLRLRTSCWNRHRSGHNALPRWNLIVVSRICRTFRQNGSTGCSHARCARAGTPSFLEPNKESSRWLQSTAANAAPTLGRRACAGACERFPMPSGSFAWILFTRATGSGVEPSERILKNMNAPGDYEEAQKWWAAKRLRANDPVKPIKSIKAPRSTPKRKQRSAPRQSK